MEHIHLILIVIIGAILLLVVLAQIFFYINTFVKICCPRGKNLDKRSSSEPRGSIPLTNVTGMSSQPTEFDFD